MAKKPTEDTFLSDADFKKWADEVLANLKPDVRERLQAILDEDEEDENTTTYLN